MEILRSRLGDYQQWAPVKFTTWQAVHLFPQMLERDFRRCRQKSLSLLVGVAPQTPLSAPLPGLAARSVPERYSPCFAGKGGLSPFGQSGKIRTRTFREKKKAGLAYIHCKPAPQNHLSCLSRFSCLRCSSIAANSFSFSRSTAATFCATRYSCISVLAFR